MASNKTHCLITPQFYTRLLQWSATSITENFTTLVILTGTARKAYFCAHRRNATKTIVRIFLLEALFYDTIIVATICDVYCDYICFCIERASEYRLRAWK